jgi:hypothetical protein
MSDEPTVAGVERREVVRRLAVGAAAVWVAPVVWTRPVGAQGTVPDPDPVEQCLTAPLDLAHRRLRDGVPVAARADLDTTFSSITSVCFEFTFSARDPLDCKERIRFYALPPPAHTGQYDVGFANTGRSPQLTNGVCLATSEHPYTTARWLDGTDRFFVVLCGHRRSTATVTGATVTVCGLVRPG